MDITEWIQVDNEDSFHVILAKDALSSIGELLRSVMKSIPAIVIGVAIWYINPNVTFALWGIEFSFSALSLTEYAVVFWALATVRDYFSNPNTNLR